MSDTYTSPRTADDVTDEMIEMTVGMAVGDPVEIHEDLVPSDRPQSGIVVEVLEETAVVELENGQRCEVPLSEFCASS